MPENTPVPPSNAPANPQQTPEDVRIPMEYDDDDKNNNKCYCVQLTVGLIVSIVFSAFGLIGLWYIKNKRRRQFYSVGCAIGIVLSIGFYAGLVLIILGKWLCASLGSC